MKKTSVTIGIPAYNEERTIHTIISDMFKQSQKEFKLNKIVIALDGCTDNTESVLKKINSKKIQILKYKERKGSAVRQNQIFSHSDSNIVVLLDADIRIPKKNFLHELIKPIIKNRADMTSCALRESDPRTFFESVLKHSMEIKAILFDKINKGNNVYNCHGPARAFSKRFYQNLRFTISEGEDMYSYFMCIKNGMKFFYVKNAYILYRLPSSFSDHLKQSLRYLFAQERHSLKIDSRLVKKELTISHRDLFNGFLSALPIIILRPIHTFYYIGVLFTVSLISYFKSYQMHTWDVASTKGHI